MKFHSLELLGSICSELRAGGSKVVLAHGCFDVFTIGHANHLRAARKLGDCLVVTVTPDRFISKGHGRPIFHEGTRAEMISTLACVDYVAINQWPDAVNTIKFLRPSFYCKGGEFKEWMTAALTLEQEAVESIGGKLVFTDCQEYHTTETLERLCKSSLQQPT